MFLQKEHSVQRVDLPYVFTLPLYTCVGIIHHCNKHVDACYVHEHNENVVHGLEHYKWGRTIAILSSMSPKPSPQLNAWNIVFTKCSERPIWTNSMSSLYYGWLRTYGRLSCCIARLAFIPWVFWTSQMYPRLSRAGVGNASLPTKTLDLVA